MKRIILTFKAGGLCNRLFPFANAYAVALEHDLVLVNTAFSTQIGYFRGVLDKGLLPSGRAYKPPRFDLLGEVLRGGVTRLVSPGSYLRLAVAEAVDLEEVVAGYGAKTLWLNGLYLLAPTLFPKYAAAIRNYFRPIDALQAKVDECVGSAVRECDILVGVHIRQGDYAYHDSGMLYYPSEEYAGLMRRMVELLPEKRVRFLVCSNVPQDDRLFSGLNCTFSCGHEVIDLYALARCQYLIGAPSSYSQWASFYGEVPRFVLNRKYEEKFGVPVTPLELNAFRIHRVGFGRYVPAAPEG